MTINADCFIRGGSASALRATYATTDIDADVTLLVGETGHAFCNCDLHGV